MVWYVHVARLSRLFLWCLHNSHIFLVGCVRRILLHVCSDSFSCHNVLILLSLSSVTNLSLLTGVCAAYMLAYRCLQMKWWAAVTVVSIPSQKASFVQCSCAHTSLPENFQCSHSVVLVPFCIIYTLHLIVVWFLQAICLPEWSLQLQSFLAFSVPRRRAGRSNTSLRTLCFHFAVTWSLPSPCYMQGDWYCKNSLYFWHFCCASIPSLSWRCAYRWNHVLSRDLW